MWKSFWETSPMQCWIFWTVKGGSATKEISWGKNERRRKIKSGKWFACGFLNHHTLHVGFSIIMFKRVFALIFCFIFKPTCYQPQSLEIICLVAPVPTVLWNLRCAPLLSRIVCLLVNGRLLWSASPVDQPLIVINYFLSAHLWLNQNSLEKKMKHLLVQGSKHG